MPGVMVRFGSDPQLVLGVGLQRRGAERLVEVRQRGVDPGARIGRRLVAVGVERTRTTGRCGRRRASDT